MHGSIRKQTFASRALQDLTKKLLTTTASELCVDRLLIADTGRMEVLVLDTVIRGLSEL